MIFPNLTPSAQVRNRDTANVLIFEDSNADIAVGAPGVTTFTFSSGRRTCRTF
ncbi:MAG: hypothetical protein R3B51_06945 [Thermodesulfobacteriota bacterium]